MHKRYYLTIAVFSLLTCITTSCQTSKSRKIEQSDRLKDQFESKMEADAFEDAKVLIGQVVELEREIEDTERLISALYLATRSSALSGNFREAIKYGSEGISLSRSEADMLNEYRIGNFLSWSYFETQEDLEKVLAHEKRQIYLADQLDNDEYKAREYNNHGYDGTVAGTIPLDTLLTYQHFANDYYAKANGNQGLWYTLMNLTWIYRLKGDLNNSEKYGKLSVAQAKTDNDWHAISEANTNLAETYLELGKVDFAASLYAEALNWVGEKEERDIHVFNVYYGKYLWEEKNDAQAISLLQEAIEFLETGEVFYEMLGRLHLATIYTQISRIEEAKDELNQIQEPRHDYISFEVRAKSEKLANQLELSNDLLNYISQAEKIGAHLLVDKLKQ